MLSPSLIQNRRLRITFSISRCIRGPRQLRLLFPKAIRQPGTYLFGGSLCIYLHVFFFLCCCFHLLTAGSLQAQSASGTITGTVTDASGAVIPGAVVTIENPVSGLLRTTKTDASRAIPVHQPTDELVPPDGQSRRVSNFATDAVVRSTVGVTSRSRCRWVAPRPR